MKRICGCHAAADLMQELDIQYFIRPLRLLRSLPHIPYLLTTKICAILLLLSCPATFTLKLDSVPLHSCRVTVGATFSLLKT